MDDVKIVDLYWDRNESAISESSKKYGAYCSSIAYNILHNDADTEECVNDTWLHAWNAIPPQRPVTLSTFLGKITRNLSFDIYRKNHRQKRRFGNMTEVLDELAECVSDKEDVDSKWAAEELIREINNFLLSLPKEKRYIFILRYWYADSIADIAERMKVSENNISVSLNRIRSSLKEYLVERGYEL